MPFDQQNYGEKSAWKWRGIFDIEITSEKVCGNDVDFSNTEITLKKVRGNDVNQQNYIEKVHGNEVEIRGNLAFDVSTKYWHRIDVGWRSVPVGKPNGLKKQTGSKAQKTKKLKKTPKSPLWKNFLYFLKKSFFIYFRKMELLYFGKWNFIAPRLKNFRRELSKLEN